MAIYFFSADIVRRSKGQSSLAASAYQNAQKHQDYRDGHVFNFTHKKDVIFHKVLLPDGAPHEYANSEVLWNAAEIKEDQQNKPEIAQSARTILIALPNEVEISNEERKDLVERFVAEVFVSQGMIADLSVHDKGDGNPHAHVLLTMREVGPDGFGLKNRKWNRQIQFWRSEWAKAQNHLLMTKGLEARVSHKSHKRRGNDDHKPTLHLGPVLSAMERRGVKTKKGNYNREVFAEREQKKLERQLELENIRNHERERGR